MDRNRIAGLLDASLGTEDILNTPILRGGILPLTEYADRVEFDPSSGLLGSIGRAVTAPARAYRGQISDNQMIEEGNNLAGWMTLGGYMSPKPVNALGAGGGGAKVGNALDVSQAARIARAQEMGFDTSKTWYHGTPQKGIDAFDATKTGRQTGDGVWLTDSYDYAHHMAGRGGQVHELYLRPGKSVSANIAEETQRAIDNNYIDMPPGSTNYEKQMAFFGEEGPDLAVRHMLADGVDSVMLKDFWDLPLQQDNLSTAMFVRDPSNIRSVNAAFDPSQSGSANLLASNGKNSSIPGLLFGLLSQADQNETGWLY